MSALAQQSGRSPADALDSDLDAAARATQSLAQGGEFTQSRVRRAHEGAVYA